MLKSSFKAVIVASCALLVASLSGCYGNWPALNQVADKVSCDMQREQLEKLARRAQADSHWDEVSLNFTIVKADDAIAVVFDDKGRISVVAKTQSQLSFGGLVRRKGEVNIVKRC